MKPFENAYIGMPVWFIGDNNPYQITQIISDDIQAKHLHDEQCVWFDKYGYVFQSFPVQLIYPHPVTIQDGREPSNCGNHECSMAKYCFGDNPLDYCECPDYWKPKEESCK